MNIDAILQETTTRRRRQKLSAITDGLGLGSAYSETLGRIKRQGGGRARLGMAALMWISYSERPLKVDELCHALGVEVGSPNLDADNVPSIGTLRACCQGLVTVDKEASTVRLIHYTLQEYLRAHPELFGTVHSTIAETCLSYLNSQQVRALSTSPSPDLQGTPFLDCSSVCWGVRAGGGFSNCAKQFVLRLFDDCNNHISTKILLESQKGSTYAVDFDKPYVFSSLHCASLFGILEIVTDWIKVEGGDIDQRDCADNTPLAWAARNGHERVVEILLKQGDVSPDKAGEDGQTPLALAAGGGHEGVAKILLERDEVNPDKPSNDGRTPLYEAARNGHMGVVKMLLQRSEVNPDKPDNCGRTPLWIAAYNGHAEVVKMLLQRSEVSPDKPNNDGRTPLWYAAYNGHAEVAKLLLQRCEVNPDKPDNDGQTPLWFAADCGHAEVVKMLLRRSEVNPNNLNKSGQTPLWRAAWNGKTEVVKMLLEQSEVNPDKPDNNGRTPLWPAAYNGHVAVVKMLLGRDDIDPSKSDKRGQTPLRVATQHGHTSVVTLLQPRDPPL